MKKNIGNHISVDADRSLSHSNTAGAGTNTEHNIADSACRTFTQEEVNGLIKHRLTRALKGMPAKDELKQFHSWRESKAMEFQDAKIQLIQTQLLQKRLDELAGELLACKKRETVLSRGIYYRFVDYVIFEANKMMKADMDFVHAFDRFCTENQELIKSMTVDIK